MFELCTRHLRSIQISTWARNECVDQYKAYQLLLNLPQGGARRRDTGKTKKDDESRDDVITKIDMKNAPLEAYYKAQNIVPEEEWDTFFDALRQPLPTTFRMAGSRQVAHELNHIIKTNYVPNMADTVFEGEPVAAPVQIP